MGSQGIGSSVVIALAAVLWLVYLTPTWFRRREYITTERNALRLQQTMRILAETAETPEPARAEITAREVAHQERLLRQQRERDLAVMRAREAEMARAATRTLATLKPALAAGAILHSTAARRLRAARAVTSGFLLVSLVSVGGGIAVGQPVPIGAGSVVVFGSLGMLHAMARVARARARTAAQLAASPGVLRQASAILDVTEPDVAPVGWTPVPLPKPLYLSKPAPQFIVNEESVARDRARELARLVAAERAAILAEQAEKVTPIGRPAVGVAGRRDDAQGAVVSDQPSRFAGMGYVDAESTVASDLNDVLRRRRAV